jgi:hypothetical protein
MLTFNFIKKAAFISMVALSSIQLKAESGISYGVNENEIQPKDYLLLTSMCSDDPSATRRWRVRNRTTSPLAYTWVVYGTSQTGSGTAQPGDNFFFTNTIAGSANTTIIKWTVGTASYQNTKASGGAKCEVKPKTCYAEEVISYGFTKRNDGGNINPARLIKEKALGEPQNSDANTSEANNNFAALGFGGEITLKFGHPVKNGPGNDVKVFETSFGPPTCARYPERIRAFASQDGCNFVYLGEGCQDTEFDFGNLKWAQYIKLVDITSLGSFAGQVADGYDVDGIMCLNGPEENPVPAALLVGSVAEAFDYFPGLTKSGSQVHISRRNKANAEGVPQNTNAINFVSLGFGGQIKLRFDYVIFDNPSTNDLKVVETSFGNPACSKYPEKALFEGSLDGNNWIPLGELCLDGELDITAAGVIQYLRITDHSKASKFGGSADGYDVDGVVVINGCDNNNNKREAEDNLTIADEVLFAEAFPNPFNNELTLSLTGSGDEKITLNVLNYLGQTVRTELLNTNGSASLIHTMNLSDLQTGVYFLSIDSQSGREVLKVVKR